MSWLTHIHEDIGAAMRRDPAARSALEVLLNYTGVHALLLHRIAHRVDAAGYPLPARLL